MALTVQTITDTLAQELALSEENGRIFECFRSSPEALKEFYEQGEVDIETLHVVSIGGAEHHVTLQTSIRKMGANGIALVYQRDPDYLTALVELSYVDIYGSKYQKFTFTKRIPPLHRACIHGDHRFAQHLLELGANMWIRFDNFESSDYTSVPFGEDLPQQIHYTPLFYTLSGDNHEILKVLLQHNLMDEVSHYDLIVTCVALGAEKCVLHLMETFPDEISLAESHMLRTACVSQPKLIEILLTKGIQFDDMFFIAFPDILESVYLNEHLTEKQCCEVTKTVLSAASQYQILQIVTSEVLLALITKLVGKPAANTSLTYNVKKYWFLMKCFDLLVEKNPQLITNEDDLVYKTIHRLTDEYGNSYPCAPLKLFFLSFLRRMAGLGFPTTCPVHGKCVLPGLIEIYITASDCDYRRWSNSINSDFLYLLEAFLGQGCDPNDAKVNVINFYCMKTRKVIDPFRSREIRYFDDLQRHVSEIYDMQVQCFMMLRNAGFLMSYDCDILSLEMLNKAIEGINRFSGNISDLHLSACLLAETDLDKMGWNFAHHLQGWINTCFRKSREMPSLPHMDVKNAMRLLCFLFDLMDQKQRNAVIAVWPSLPEEETDGTVSIPGLDRLLEAKSSMMQPLSLAKISNLYVRNILLKYCEYQRIKIRSSRGSRADIISGKFDLDKELARGNCEYLYERKKVFLCRNPIDVDIFHQLKLPKIIHDEISGMRCLKRFLHNLWHFSDESC